MRYVVHQYVMERYDQKVIGFCYIRKGNEDMLKLPLTNNPSELEKQFEVCVKLAKKLNRQSS